MAADFIETIVDPRFADGFGSNRLVNSFFHVPSRKSASMSCRIGAPPSYLNSLKDFFGVDRGWECVGSKIVDNGEGIEIYAKPKYDTDEPEILVGTARVNRSGRDSQSFTLVSDALHFWLPPEQNVFPGAHRVHTPSYYVTDAVATYRNRTGNISRQMSFTLDPRTSDPLRDDLRIGGILAGRLFINFKEGI